MQIDSPAFVIGIDFGTDSVRAILVDVGTGEIAGKGLSHYRRWADKLYCHPSDKVFRQHPSDYLESLDEAVMLALSSAGSITGRYLKAICVDSTGSTPAPADEDGRPLALRPEFKDDPAAMFYLWKDHSSSAEAEEFNAAASSWRGEDYLRFQGIYSSEWFWAKILNGVRHSKAVRKAAWNWIEECEWITAELCGAGPNFARSATAAGHKALWHSAFGGLPSRDFLVSIDPYLGLIHDRYTPPMTPNQVVGELAPHWRSRWNVADGVKICGSLFDAHAGAVGCGIKPGTMVKVVGTSAVDMMVERAENLASHDTKRLFGMAENSIIPGFLGIEAGQAAFGDVFMWLENLALWSERRSGTAAKAESILNQLNQECLGKPPSNVLALDWFNGRRYPDDNDRVKGAFFNLDLGVDLPDLYQALVVGVVFGAKRMFDGYLDSGIVINDIVCAGGVAGKSPYIMQVMADVFEKNVGISASSEACAVGSVMYAACGAGIYDSIFKAQKIMGEGQVRKHVPDRSKVHLYQELYDKYLAAGNFVERQLA